MFCSNRKFVCFLCFIVLCLSPAAATAQSYPSRPVKIVVPYAPGGGTDVTARLIAEKLSERLKQPVVVDNKPGAGGRIGTAAVAHAEPDGYTLILGNDGPNSVGPILYKDLNYDQQRDFAPITLLTLQPLFLLISAESLYRTVEVLVDEAKRNPGRLDYASTGIGSLSQLTAEMFNLAAGVKIAHVPYKGASPATLAVMSGETALYFAAAMDAIPQLRQTRMRALAVTSKARSPAAPEVATLSEAGLPGFSIEIWYGLLAPARTPASIIEFLNREVREVLEDSSVRTRLIAMGAVPSPSTPAKLGSLIRERMTLYADTIAAAGISPE